MKNEPAFPLTSETACRPGLTKLEYAAIEAMNGVLSDSHIMDLIRADSEEGMEDTAAFVAGLSVEYAGALLAELEKET